MTLSQRDIFYDYNKATIKPTQWFGSGAAMALTNVQGPVPGFYLQQHLVPHMENTGHTTHQVLLLVSQPRPMLD